MSLDFLQTKDKENDRNDNFLNSFIKELRNSLNKNQILVIDRFEGDFAVCENQSTYKMVDIPKNLIPKEALEGMTIKLQNEQYVIDYENCIITRKNIIENLKKSWEKEEGAEYYIASSVLDKAIKCSNIFMKQNIYIKDEELIKTIKKGDIVKLVLDKFSIDEEKNEQINAHIKELIK